MNNVTLVGRLTANPELKIKKGDTDFYYVNVSIAVDRDKKDKNGNKETDFINLAVFGKNAQNFANFLVSGSLVSIEGSLRVDSYQNQEGKKVYSTKVVVSKFRDLDFKKLKQSNKDKGELTSGVTSEQNPTFEPSFEPNGLDPQGFQAIDDDDIPF